ncbi:MAG: GNAT family N-acetyltransferase [Flavobacteriaceae bacterium]|nr:GNAT family N-acetyltransferase [Flavobacteriaceae bacterium]|tara:strand:- start:104354 stop:104812 length:459 start_codon:yes stop_codon:yes gene_type:complete
MIIVKATPSDAKSLTELTIRSKDFWGYGIDLIESWREELTITPSFIEYKEVIKLVHNETTLGFYAYSIQEEGTVKLEFLFIEPDEIGKGIGKLLMNDFFDRVKPLNTKRVLLDADPNAEEFYKKFGFTTIGKLESSIEGRYLPIMEYLFDQR